MYRNSKYYRITALTLALLMFTTSVGMAVDMHYCGGQLKTVSFFGKAQSCHKVPDIQASSMRVCPLHQRLQIDDKNGVMDQPACCQNRSLHIQLDQDQNIQPEGLTITKPLQQFVVSFIQAFFTFHAEPAPESIPFAQYRPPLIRRDIPVLTQSFLL